jgi:hypothetical protein
LARVYDAARKKSILLQFIPRRIMLYGNRSVSYVQDSDGVPQRLETNLGSFGTSFEMPRMEIIDPLGLQVMLLTFRGERPPV